MILQTRVQMLCAVTVAVCLSASTLRAADVNLGIADEETYKRPVAWSGIFRPTSPVEALLLGDGIGPASRPAMSIAWRNAAQIEEVEVRIRNLGKDAGEGRVSVDVLDETGKVLLHLEPPDEQKLLRVPGVDDGGRDGKVIRMKASWELNTLIDRFDRTRTRYDVRATVDTDGPDTDPFDNSKTKSWHVPFAVRAGFRNVYNYVFHNYERTPVTVSWKFEHTPEPRGWRIEGVPTASRPFTLMPGQEVLGTLALNGPTSLVENDFLEARLTLVNVATGRPFQQREWFQVYDTVAPTVSNYRAVFTEDHRIAIQLLAADKGSGILEATGVITEYSTDGGRTWAARAHNYKSGNFVRPTLFETVLGPFAPGTAVQLRLSVMDTAGNAQTLIPDDATAFEAPPNAEKLLDQAYVFPRTQPNPLFELDTFTEIQRALKEANTSIAVKPLSADDLRNTSVGARRTLDAATIGDLTETMRAIDKMGVNPAAAVVRPLRRLATPADSLLNMSTLEVVAK